MKKRTIKVLCALMAAQVIFAQVPFSVNAQEDQLQAEEIHSHLQSTDLEREVQSEASEEHSEKETARETTEEKSSLMVKLQHHSVKTGDHQFRIYLENTGIEKTVSLDPENHITENSVIFEGLSDGKYRLRIESEGFVPYMQDVTVESGYGYTVTVATGDDGIDKTGSMPYGDLQGDGYVDEKDAIAVVDALESRSCDLLFDVNADGEVNLLDLETAVRLFDMTNGSITARESAVTKYVIPGLIQTASGDTTSLQGDAQGVLNGTGAVLLSPAGQDKEIRADNPVELSFEFPESSQTVKVDGIVLQTPSENQIDSGKIMISYMEEGKEKTGTVLIGGMSSRNTVNVIGTAELSRSGQISVRLNGQIAVKKVTITVTSVTGKDASLAEISRVEFVNGMENYIPAPTLDIPQVIRAEAGNKSLFVSWKKVVNVTGYQVLVTSGGYTEYISTSDTSAEITMFRNQSLKNKVTYEVAVRSINGTWNSGYDQTYALTPRYDTVPDAPDSLKLTGDYKIVRAVWTAPRDDAADSYTLYYKREADKEFRSVSGISSTSHTLYDLDDEEAYVLYVTAVNEHGESAPSLQASVHTKSIKPVQFSQYRIINGAEEEGALTDHIVQIRRRAGTYVNNSILDGESNVSALAVADNDFQSYYQINDWDDAVTYHTGNEGWGLTVELDQVYKMDRFAVAAPDDSTYYTGAAVYYWKDGQKKKAEGITLQRKKDGNERAYYQIQLSAPIETDTIQFGFQVSYYGTHRIQVSEIRLYEYDPLADEIRDLYTDELYIALKDGVAEEDFARLQEKIDTKINGDYHPERTVLQKELDAARKLFEEETVLDDIQYISTNIGSSYDNGLKLSGLNGWQPLGITAEAGEEIVIYVGGDTVRQGDPAKLQLVMTQQHGEQDQLSRTIGLNAGRNVITIPEIVSTDVEKGGPLYIQYTGKNPEEKYAVRISGGERFPVLDLNSVADDSQRRIRIREYIEELEEYCAGLESRHEQHHDEKILFFSRNPYDEKTCILNTTDIMFDHMMISGPATQILAGLGGVNGEERMLFTSEAMDSMQELFYQHKGLAENFAEGEDSSVEQSSHVPTQHLNIRYMKMFSGAFMYAGGNHIGVEWNSVRDLILKEPPVIDDNGRLVQGSYFGWGIAHEIGHQINQPEYAVAEVTNNYFAVLAQADGTNESVRFSYEDVFRKVTSNTTGYPSSVFTQMAMYWQIHLAYDDDYAQKTYDDHREIMNRLIYARVDTYARDPESFNSEGWEIPLCLTEDPDQNVMRLVSAAARKNLTDFFTRWGYSPDQQTAGFMGQFEQEERAVYYINDEAKTACINGTAQNLSGKAVLNHVEIQTDHSDVILKMDADERYAGQIMGYEITRVTTRKGIIEKEVIGFTTGDTFTDCVTLGSRAVSYEICPVDSLTYRAQVVSTETIKVTSDGNYDKSQFNVTTNMSSEQDHHGDATEQNPCEPETEAAVNMVIDGNKKEQYTGKSQSVPYIVLDLKQRKEVSAIRYYADSREITEYLIEVSADGKEYVQAAEGRFEMENEQDTIYLTNGTDPWVTTYDVRYIRLTATEQAGKEIGITEIDVLGPSGDNIEFGNEQGKALIGKLAQDYVYDIVEGLKIPQGSVVFAGSYKGNPAYNVVVLYDQDGNIVGGTKENGEMISNQIILAPDPGNALLGEVSEGMWIYWIDPDAGFVQLDQIKAELYRVDHATTNEGDRLTSDTVYVKMPDHLEEIWIEE